MDLFSKKIIGQHVFLRLLTVADAPDYLQYLKKNKNFHEPFSPLRNQDDFYTLTNASTLTNQRDRVFTDQQYLFGIFEKDTKKLVGKINISGIVRAAFQSCFLGYDMDESTQNKGYMTETIRMITSFAFHHLHFHRLQASIMPRNIASQKVVEKAGFVREGYSENYLKINNVWEDHYIYSITIERFERLPLVSKQHGVIE